MTTRVYLVRHGSTVLSAEDAFAVLRWHSSHANLKLRDVATLITKGMSAPLTPGETPNQRISRLLAAVVPQFNAARELSPPAVAS